jgi:hypothetical protein
MTGILQILFASYAGAGLTADFLVIAGGGGGTSAGAGGAGGYRCSVTGENSGGGAVAESQLTLDVGTAYTVTVGAGGTVGLLLVLVRQTKDLTQEQVAQMRLLTVQEVVVAVLEGRVLTLQP